MSIVNTLCNILYALVDYIANHGGFGDDKTLNQADETSTLLSIDGGKSKASVDLDFLRMSNKKPTFLQRNPNQLTSLFGKLFVFAYVWAFGSNFDCKPDDQPDLDASRGSSIPNIINTFDTFVRDLFESDLSLGVRLPSGNNLITNYYVDLDKGQFVPWENLVPSTAALIEKHVANQVAISDTSNTLDDPSPNAHDIESRALVTTVDTVQYGFIMSLLALNQQPVLLTGSTGVGKTALILDVLKRLSQEGGTGTAAGTILGAVLATGGSSILESIVDTTTSGKESRRKKLVYVSQLQFSAQTSATRTRQLIQSKLIKRGRDVLGAKPGKKVHFLFHSRSCLKSVPKSAPDLYENNSGNDLPRNAV